MRFKSQQIVLSCLGLCTQNPGLREVDLEPSHKRGSGKINTLTKEEISKRKQVVLYSLESHIDPST